MSAEMGKTPKFSQKEMQRVLSSPEGKELLAMLSKSEGFQAARVAFKKGDMNTVQSALQPVLQTKEAGELLHKINGK